MPQSGGEDDEKEADGEDLGVRFSFARCIWRGFRSAHEGESNDGLETCCHDEGAYAQRLQGSGLSGVQRRTGLSTPKGDSC